jgi:hypothetical protein
MTPSRTRVTKLHGRSGVRRVRGRRVDRGGGPAGWRRHRHGLPPLPNQGGADRSGAAAAFRSTHRTGPRARRRHRPDRRLAHPDTGAVRPSVTVEEVHLLIPGLAQASATMQTRPDTLDRAIDVVLTGLPPSHQAPPDAWSTSVGSRSFEQSALHVLSMSASLYNGLSAEVEQSLNGRLDRRLVGLGEIRHRERDVQPLVTVLGPRCSGRRSQRKCVALAGYRDWIIGPVIGAGRR